MSLSLYYAKVVFFCRKVVFLLWITGVSAVQLATFSTHLRDSKETAFSTVKSFCHHTHQSMIARHMAFIIV